MQGQNPVDKEQEKTAFLKALRNFIVDEGDKVKPRMGNGQSRDS